MVAALIGVFIAGNRFERGRIGPVSAQQAVDGAGPALSDVSASQSFQTKPAP
jgi:hypothetical protein